ncbi:DUF302 domain-containing protein [Streptomyces sp. NPDC057271]|uniref:DUF302 domain-containing protein n=1 Tax=unclassified Streptomyces TaxID=2593676 RepID=UPI00362BA056
MAAVAGAPQAGDAGHAGSGVGDRAQDRGASLERSFGEVQRAVRQALSEQGFDVPTEVDVQATLKAELGHAMEPYLLRGACSPPLARRALETDRSVACRPATSSSGPTATGS